MPKKKKKRAADVRRRPAFGDNFVHVLDEGGNQNDKWILAELGIVLVATNPSPPIDFGDGVSSGPVDVQAAAGAILDRARDAKRVGKLFAQDGYPPFDPDGTGADDWARA